MKVVLDASMALGWLITRQNPTEAALAQQTFATIQSASAYVPALWYAEIANALLVFERAKRLAQIDSTHFLADLATLHIDLDQTPADRLQPRVLSAARRYHLSAYDATYLELATRLNAPLATFDRQLAEAFRQSGGQVFGD